MQSLTPCVLAASACGFFAQSSSWCVGRRSNDFVWQSSHSPVASSPCGPCCTPWQAKQTSIGTRLGAAVSVRHAASGSRRSDTSRWLPWLKISPGSFTDAQVEVARRALLTVDRRSGVDDGSPGLSAASPTRAQTQAGRRPRVQSRPPPRACTSCWRSGAARCRPSPYVSWRLPAGDVERSAAGAGCPAVACAFWWISCSSVRAELLVRALVAAFLAAGLADVGRVDARLGVGLGQDVVGLWQSQHAGASGAPALYAVPW